MLQLPAGLLFCYSACMKSALIAAAVLFTALPASAESFKGYPCTQDCSGHKAGYAWAQKKAITDSADCSGHSNSFIEGCRAAVEETHPAFIEPAAGAADKAIDPGMNEDPFALEPFQRDPFAPDVLPGISD